MRIEKFTACRNPELLRLLNSEKYVCIDVTFRYTLKGDRQILVIMIYDEDMKCANILCITINSK